MSVVQVFLNRYSYCFHTPQVNSRITSPVSVALSFIVWVIFVSKSSKSISMVFVVFFFSLSMVSRGSTSVTLVMFFSLSVYARKMKWFDNRNTGLLTYLKKKKNMASNLWFFSYSSSFQDFPPKRKIKNNFISRLVIIQWSFCISLPISFQSLAFSSVLPSRYYDQILSRNNKSYIDCPQNIKQTKKEAL